MDTLNLNFFDNLPFSSQRVKVYGNDSQTLQVKLCWLTIKIVSNQHRTILVISDSNSPNVRINFAEQSDAKTSHNPIG